MASCLTSTSNTWKNWWEGTRSTVHFSKTQLTILDTFSESHVSREQKWKGNVIKTLERVSIGFSVGSESAPKLI